MRVALHPGQLALIDDLPEHGKKKHGVLASLRELDRKTVVDPHYVLVQTDAQLAECIEEIETSKFIALDTEHRSAAQWWSKKAVGLSVYTPSNSRAYFVPNRMVHAVRNFTDDEIQAAFEDVLYDENIFKVGQNIKGDLHFLRETYNLFVRGVVHDVLLAGTILNENVPHDLESLSIRYFKAKKWKLPHSAPIETWPIRVATQYACKDAEMTWRCGAHQRRIFEKPEAEKLRALMYDMELPVAVKIVSMMEQRGVGWDDEYHRTIMKPTIEEETKRAADRVYEQTGPINLEAPGQIASAFFDMLELPRIRDNHTDKAVLTELAKLGHTVAADLLEYRKYGTINKMFVRQLPEYVVNGRIYCTFNTIGAETGRMSAKEPNLMQIPKRIGPIIRRAFIPSPGKVFVAFDFNQIELRVLAHLSQDPTLCQAFISGQDAHTAVMCGILGVNYEDYERNPDEPVYVATRVKAKTVNFGVLYGMGRSKLASTVGMEKDEAAQFIDDYFARMPKVKKWIDKVHADCFKNLFVETIMGRKRRLPDIKSSDRMISSMAEREAVNAEIQGSVADFCKKTMLDHDAILTERNWPFELLLQIHDELIYEVPVKWLTHNMSSLDVLNEAMANVYPLRVPIVVKHEILTRWGDKAVLEEEAA